MDDEMTPEQRQRLEQATLLLKTERLLDQIERKKTEPWLLRDLSISWALVASARGQIEACVTLMPEIVAHQLGLIQTRDHLDAVIVSLGEALDAHTQEEEGE